MKKKLVKKPVPAPIPTKVLATGVVMYTPLAVHDIPSIEAPVTGDKAKGDNVEFVAFYETPNLKFQYGQMRDGKWLTIRHGEINYVAVTVLQ